MGKTSQLLFEGYRFLKDDKVDMRIRMLYIVDIAVVFVCAIEGLNLLMLGQPYMTIAPNLMMIVIATVSGYVAGAQHRYNLASIILIFGCADVVGPIMFFLAGGCDSGMPLIFIFSVVLVCLMAKGGTRVLFLALTLAEDVLCMFIGHFYDEWVIPLKGDNAGFYDMFQTFIYVGAGISIVIVIHLSTYDRQKKLLEQQREELYRRVVTDELTGLFNRHAYYDESNAIIEAGYSEDVVVVTLDVNGLKKVNDTLGHAEGDKYIQKAANTISKAYGEYGKIFRTGGDEFVAILHCDIEVYKGLVSQLRMEVNRANKMDGGELAIAVGAVAWKNNKDLSYTELEKLADKKMYDDKRNYYMSPGKDRRHS